MIRKPDRDITADEFALLDRIAELIAHVDEQLPALLDHQIPRQPSAGSSTKAPPCNGVTARKSRRLSVASRTVR